MKKIILVFMLVFFSFNVMAASDPVKLKWTSKGLSVGFPAVKSQTRKFNSNIRSYERAPKRYISQGFRDTDRNINKAIKKKMKKWFD